MARTLLLEKGELVISEEKIIIRDNAKKERLIRLLTSAMWSFYGVISVLRYMKTGDEFLLWSGVIIGTLHLIALIFDLFRTTKSEVYLQEVVRAAFKKRNGNEFLDLKLKSGLKRRISKIGSVSDEMRMFLSEKNIEVK